MHWRISTGFHVTIETAYIAAVCFAAFQSLRRGFPFPLFRVYLLAWLAEAGFVSDGPRITVAALAGTTPSLEAVRQWADLSAWLSGPWILVETAFMALTLLACIEAAKEARSYASPFVRVQLLTISVAFPACLVGLGAGIILPVSGTLLQAFRIARGWAWVLMTVMLLVTILAIALEGRVSLPPAIWIHLGLLLGVLMAHAAICWLVDAPDGVRAIGRLVYRCTAICACIGWCGLPSAKPASYLAHAAGDCL